MENPSLQVFVSQCKNSYFVSRSKIALALLCWNDKKGSCAGGVTWEDQVALCPSLSNSPGAMLVVFENPLTSKISAIHTFSFSPEIRSLLSPWISRDWVISPHWADVNNPLPWKVHKWLIIWDVSTWDGDKIITLFKHSYGHSTL